MSTAKLNATNSGSITITLSSVTNNSFAVSNAIDNSTNLYLSALIQVKLKTGASGVSATGFFNVWLLRSTDGGSTYSDNNAVLLGSMAAVANATTYTTILSTEAVGPLGTSWKIAVENRTGATTDTTAGNHKAEFTGIKFDIV